VYVVELDPLAAEQATRCRSRRSTPFLELRALLEVQPLIGLPLNPDNPKANMLTHTFGSAGMATYFIVEHLRLVYVVASTGSAERAPLRSRSDFLGIVGFGLADLVEDLSHDLKLAGQRELLAVAGAHRELPDAVGLAVVDQLDERGALGLVRCPGGQRRGRRLMSGGRVRAAAKEPS
jgi:hypothetical protein